MSTTKEYRDFVLEQLAELDGITARPMMGEYLLYQNGVLFGGIYDERLLVKITETNQKYQMLEEIPYKNAKPMYLVEDLDDPAKLTEIITDTVEGLK